MVIVEFAAALANQAIGFLKKVYDVLKDTKESLSGVLSWLTHTFPFNDPERTLGLSVLVFMICIGLILVFSSSSWNTSGVSDVDSTVSLGVSFNGPGDSSVVSGVGDGGGVDEFINKTAPGRFGNCLSNEDCRIEGPENLGDLKCCKPEFFEGYSCAGKCLYDESYSETYCTHPGSCWHLGESWSEHADADDPNRCDVWVGWGFGGAWDSPNNFCRRKASGVNGVFDARSRCCGSRDSDFRSVCYGYCLKSGSSYDCNDVTACFEELAVNVVGIEPGDLID